MTAISGKRWPSWRRMLRRVVREDYDDAKQIHPASYLIGLALIVSWHIVPRELWAHTHNPWLAALAFGVCVGGFLAWGYAVDRMSNWLAARRRREESTGIDDNLLDVITVGQRVAHVLAMVVLVPIIVAVAILWYGLLLVFPVGALVFLSWLVSLAFHTAGTVMMVASVPVGLVLGAAWVHWWIKKATPDQVATANAVAIAAAG